MYHSLTTWDNLLLAYQKASKGKRGLANVATFEHRLEENLLRLQAELRQRTYAPGGYVNFVIHEPKRRIISAAPFRDRVVHHALGNVIEPIFERGFISHSYANRVGKGTHRALDYCQQLARRYRYVLGCDGQQFFASLDHAILRGILQRKIVAAPHLPAHCAEEIMWLVDQILASGEGVLAEAYEMRWFAGDNLLAACRPRGLPIGNLTSQFWANCYLDGFDHFVKQELGCKGYVRYVDDMLLFANEKQTLWQWQAKIEKRLAQLRLTIHLNAQPRPVTEGIPFLGFVVWPQQRRLKQRKGFYFRRRLWARVATYRKGEISLNQLTAGVRGWVNHVRYGNTVGLRKAVLWPVVIPKQRRLASGWLHERAHHEG